jgi:hypothetical protein
MNPKNHKNFKEGIAEEVGVHQNVVEDFITFYYSRLRKNLSEITYPKIFVDGLGTFVLRKQKLDKSIKRNKDILGNLGKQTYGGYEKTIAVKDKLENLEKAQKMYNEILEEKRQFKTQKNENRKI